MRIDYKTMLEAFEETEGRGDALTISRKDLVQLATVPFKRFAPIFYQLFKWFVSGDDTPLKDPLANAMLERLKEQQLENARRRKAFLVEQSNRAKKGAEARWGARNARGQPRASTVGRGQPRDAQTKTETKTETELEMKSNSVSVGAGASRAVAAPPTPLTVSEARKFLAMDAPQISSLPGMTSDKGIPTRRCVGFVGADFYDAVELAGNEVLGRDPDEDNDATFKTFDDPIASIGERLEETGKLDVLKRVLVKAVVDSEDKEVKNRAAFVIARCRKGAAAIQATMGG